MSIGENKSSNEKESEDEVQVQPIMVRRKCSNQSWRIKLYMDQLYFDLGASWKNNLSNTKIFHLLPVVCDLHIRSTTCEIHEESVSVCRGRGWQHVSESTS